jgi:hypothetical protein
VLKELDSVRLKRPLPTGDVPVGSDGVGLYVYLKPTLGYEVEFFDPSHRSLGAFSLTAADDYVEKRP